MSTGQRAMAVAMVENFTSENIEHGDKGAAADAADVRQARVSQARTVLKHAPDLAALVLSGAEHLKSAYEIARARKQAAETAAEASARLKPDRKQPTTNSTDSIS